ncbi:hypothetical protein CHS0354_029476 [Potamilus streckersoni]|uniref:GPR158/179 extracellular domain-containing protein n=1 Tax=Potamilus streckersoni TaxID=2493646 RepID=A0AAE0STF2_9BIVA|nr:hypothetical protein CHS0354_029476 [Potamilus streckersoni]
MFSVSPILSSARTCAVPCVGVATIDIDMTDLDINQCDQDSATDDKNQKKLDIFRGTHLCPETTKCEQIIGKGFTTGAYLCVCLPRYYFPDTNAEIKAFSGKDLETYFRSETSTENPEGNLYRCIPCARGCETCVDGSPCLYQSSDSLKLTMMALILLNVTIVCCLSVATFVYRKKLNESSDIHNNLRIAHADLLPCAMELYYGRPGSKMFD